MPIFPLGIVGPWEIVIIALIVLLLFGGKKIPELMKGLGKGVKSFKDGLNEVEKDIKDVDATLNDKGNNPRQSERQQRGNVFLGSLGSTEGDFVPLCTCYCMYRSGLAVLQGIPVR